MEGAAQRATVAAAVTFGDSPENARDADRADAVPGQRRARPEAACSGSGTVSGRAIEVAEVDLGARVVYLPVRHHSPACAWHVKRLIESLAPDRVLIEGPSDADRLLPFLADPRTRPPVALYTTYRQCRKGEPPVHHAAYYPLCDYSPEWVAVRAAAACGAEVRFIDLTYVEAVRAGRSDVQLTSLQSEAHLRHSAFLAAAAARAGARDPDDLWDHLFEADYRDRPPAELFRGVLAYCAAARLGAEQEALAADGTLEREACMAAHVSEAEGRVVVVTGGFHTVALPSTAPQRPGPLRLAPGEDAGVTLMRYHFEQLDRLNGYASGMPLPGLYQRSWENADAADTMVALARELRGKGAEPSPAEAISAAAQMHRLAHLRGHARPTREDLLDAVRSCFVKGSADIEGVQVMARTLRFLAGCRQGAVPPDAGRPPLVLDFEARAGRLRLKLDGSEERDLVADLYRSESHRRASRLLHSLQLLGVPFAIRLRGPDFVTGDGLERIQEVWRYQWQPATEGGLIEASRWGGTVDEAAAACLEERFRSAEAADGRADIAASLVLEAARCGLHRRLADLVRRTAALVATDASFVSLTAAAQRLVLADRSCEPLQLHGDADLHALAEQTWLRAGFLLPRLIDTSEDEEVGVIDALITWRQTADALGDPDATRELRERALRQLLGDGNPACAGAAAGLLHGDGALGDDEVTRAACGRLLAAAADPVAGARFLFGLLRTARACCWQAEGLVEGLHQVLVECDEAVFLAMLPHLRLAFADLTPRETDRVAQLVARLGGDEGWRPRVAPDVGPEELLLAGRVEQLLAERLGEDGIGGFLDG